MTCLITGLHATNPKCRASIRARGLLPARPMAMRPFGVYVFREDGEFDHPTWCSRVYWTCGPRQDLWRVAYFGPLCMDQYVTNGMIFFDRPSYVTLVTSN